MSLATFPYLSLPKELQTYIADFLDLKSTISLSQACKKTHSIASQCMEQTKVFYSSLVKLQQHYTLKQHLLITLAHDTKNVKARTLEGVLISLPGDLNKNEPVRYKIELLQKPTAQDNEDEDIFLNSFKDIVAHRPNSELQKLIDKHEETRAKVNSCHAFDLIPEFSKTLSATMIDTSEAYNNDSYWHKEEGKVNITFFPIRNLSLSFPETCAIPDQLRNKIMQSVACANLFYQRISQNCDELKKTIDVNALSFSY